MDVEVTREVKSENLLVWVAVYIFFFCKLTSTDQGMSRGRHQPHPSPENVSKGTNAANRPNRYVMKLKSCQNWKHFQVFEVN